MARFVRDKDSFIDSDQPEKQKMSVRFYTNAFEDPDMLWCQKITPSDSLPMLLLKYPDIVTYIKRGQLWKVNLEYDKDQIEAIGVHDELEFSSGGQKECVRILRAILSTSKIQIFFHYKTDGYLQAVNLLKTKLRYEKECPAFHEYLSKNDKYV